MLIILFYDSKTNTHYPGAFILINNTYYQSYCLAINAFKNIITKYNSKILKLESITVDFEESLIKAVTNVFNKIRIIACFNHYMYNLEKNARMFGLYKTKALEVEII